MNKPSWTGTAAYSGQAQLHIPAHHEHPFRTNVNTDSGSTWTVIPAEDEHFLVIFRNRCSPSRNGCSRSTGIFL